VFERRDEEKREGAGQEKLCEASFGEVARNGAKGLRLNSGVEIVMASSLKSGVNGKTKIRGNPREDDGAVGERRRKKNWGDRADYHVWILETEKKTKGPRRNPVGSQAFESL